MKAEKRRPVVKAERDVSEVPPPSEMTVQGEPRVVLYRPDGTPLVRQIGFKP